LDKPQWVAAAVAHQEMQVVVVPQAAAVLLRKQAVRPLLDLTVELEQPMLVVVVEALE
jgi:hypothetical protein